jgi:hypothetical protein
MRKEMYLRDIGGIDFLFFKFFPREISEPGVVLDFGRTISA